MATNETWIIYKADSSSAPGWEDRHLSPNGGLTAILAEEWNWSEQIPQVGDRARDYANLADPGNGVTHGKDGDWIVAEVQQFTSPDTDADVGRVGHRAAAHSTLGVSRHHHGPEPITG